MKRGFARLHRTLGLAMAVFWLMQAVTGSLLVFRWELEDALLPGTAMTADPAGLGARLHAIGHDGGRVAALWASSSAATRYDVYYEDATGEARAMRVDGAGTRLRDAAETGYFVHGAIWDTLTLIHTELLAGKAGRWIVAASGMLLISNLIAGLYLAWPRSQGWRLVMFGRLPANGTDLMLSWHRRLGLGLGVLCAPLFLAGVLLCFEDELRTGFDARVPVPTARDTADAIAPGAALATAAALHPGAQLSAVVMPRDGAPWYRVRQRRTDDLPSVWGTSTVFVSAADGRVLGDYPAAEAPAARAFMDFLFPLHTGQAAGAFGRAFVLLQGVWLLLMITLGLRLRRARIARQRPAVPSRP